MAGLQAEKARKRRGSTSAFLKRGELSSKGNQEVRKKQNKVVATDNTASRSTGPQDDGDAYLSKAEQSALKKDLARLKAAITKLESLLTGGDKVSRDAVGKGVDAIASMANAV